MPYAKHLASLLVSPNTSVLRVNELLASLPNQNIIQIWKKIKSNVETTLRSILTKTKNHLDEKGQFLTFFAKLQPPFLNTCY